MANKTASHGFSHLPFGVVSVETIKAETERRHKMKSNAVKPKPKGK